MKFNNKQIQELLRGRRVLVVEDDVSVAEDISKLLEPITGIMVVLAHSMESARDAICGAVSDGRPFDLAVVDVRLPETEEDFRAIRGHEKTVATSMQTIDEIGEHPEEENAKSVIRDARFRRAEAIQAMDALVRPDGGIVLVENSCRLDFASTKAIAVLYVTAIDNHANIERGLKAANGRSAWLVKPVGSEEILDKSAELVGGLPASGGTR